MTPADLSRLVALVPVRSLSGAKSRLGEPLDPEERRDLIMAMLRRTVEAALAARSLADVVVVSKDPEALATARAMRAAAILQRSDGLNEGLTEARAAVAGVEIVTLGRPANGARVPAGTSATALIVLPADLPGVSGLAIDSVAQAAVEATRHEPGRPVVVLVTDHHGSGTNALLLAPPDAIDFQFGEGSRAAHAAAARAAGAEYVEIGGPLAFDVDTPEDLLAADMRGLGHEAGR
jgi:2-phospho-L-lactate guanylyltransferase